MYISEQMLLINEAVLDVPGRANASVAHCFTTVPDVVQRLV
jgi:hypothetical protein